MQTFAQRHVPPLELLREFLGRELPPLSPKDERYTTAKTKAWCLARAGLERYDLDVAACRESHLARDWYGLDHRIASRRDGLALEWPGHSFGNIPFTQWGHWIAMAWWRFLFDLRFKSHSMILPNDRTEQEPWQQLIAPYRDHLGPWLTLHHMPNRTKYSAPGLNGQIISNRNATGGSPFFSSCLLVWSRAARPLVIQPEARAAAGHGSAQPAESPASRSPFPPAGGLRLPERTM